MLKRHVPLIVIGAALFGFQYAVQKNTPLTNTYGIGIGTQILTNLYQYFELLALPLGIGGSASPILLLIVVTAFLLVIVQKRSAELLFMGIVATVNILPETTFQLYMWSARYTYLSATASAILLASLADAGARLLHSRVLRILFLSTAVLAALLLGIRGSSEEVQWMNDTCTRQTGTLS